MQLKVLIIEDNVQNMYMLSYLLRSRHYEVLQAYNGRDGITLASEKKPDVILLDIQLPEINGYQVAQELRRKPELDPVPIIAVTSHAMAGDREKALGAGANGYIEKPIDPDNFINRMESYFSNDLLAKKQLP